MHEILDGDLGTAARRLARGQIGAAELTQAAIRRIEATPEARACFLRFEPQTALAQARDAERGRASGGPLNGVPLAHKDILARRGRTISFASHKALHLTADETASALASLDAAGAVNLGGLHLSEFAMGPAGWTPHYGFLANPCDPTRVTGGSSSGSAAAVARRLVFAALGTDTGGSIRVPAAFCGVVGFKPSIGAVATRGCFPVAESLDVIGPLARSVSDCARIFDALSGAHTADGLETERRLRFGVLRLESLPAAPDPEIRSAHESALKRLAAAGHDLVEVSIDSLGELSALCGAVFLTEGAAVHAKRLQTARHLIGPQVVERLLQGLALPGALYLRAKRARDGILARLRAATFAQVDAVLLPTSPCAPPLQAVYRTLPDTGAILDFNGRVAAYTPAFSYLGVPALSLPFPRRVAGTAGYGLQMVADVGEDAKLLRAARAAEMARDGA